MYGDREMSKTKILLLTLLLAVTPLFLFAQSVGKVVGTVVDKSSGEPLPGVNVSIEGTQMGAATDVDGYYVILNVPVGTFDLRANFIGYGDVLLEGVRVNANLTTEANFRLAEAAIEGQAVVITAEKPLVEKNVTQSVSFVTSEDLENIPIRGFANVVATQNSVVLQDGNIHIRGGRDDEVGYYVDGAASVNPLTNTQSLHVIQEAVEEFQVLAGGYTAEFGNANSGIIRTELKTGTNDYHLSVDFQTDKFASEGSQFLNTYSYREHTGVATLSGPLFNDKIRFFLAGENTSKGDRVRRFSEGFSFKNLIDENPENAAYLDTIASYDYPDGFTPNQGEDLWALQGTLLFDMNPLQLRISGTFNTDTREGNTRLLGGSSNNVPMLSVLNDRTVDNVTDNLLLSAKLTYVLSPTSFLDGSVSLYQNQLEREDSYFGGNWQKWYDSTAVAQATNGAVTFRNRWNPRDNYRFNGIDFARNGTPNPWYLKREQNYIGGALNLVTQYNRFHEIKIGGDFRSFTIRQFVIQPDVMETLETNNVTDLKDVPITTYITSGRPNNYGYDIYGNKAENYQVDAATGFQTADAPKNPLFGSFYIQDKIEYKDLIINAGLRYDYFDSEGQRLKDPQNITYDAQFSTIDESNWENVDAFSQVSPRLGFSFPVNERTVFYMQYGKFIQMPQLIDQFNGSAIYNQRFVNSGFADINPVGTGLDPTRTTSYEIGFRQQISSVAAFDVAGFYRNVRGQVQIERIFPDPNTGLGPFSLLTNGDFATTKGFELSMTLRRINRLQAQLSYTLTQAEGTGSTSNTAVGAVEQDAPRPTTINPLDFNQVHRGSINADYRFGRNDGGPILQNLGLNMLFTFNSGHPYTFARSEVGQADAYNAGVDYMNDTRSRRALEAIGSSTTPFNYNFDLRLDKSFTVTQGLGATVYMRVNNLFNTRNVINVYNATGNAEDDGFIFNENIPQRNSFVNANGEQYLDIYEAINIKNGQAYWDQLGLQLWDHPRQIFFGLKLNY